jgi:hypothetical protein
LSIPFECLAVTDENLRFSVSLQLSYHLLLA